jgi:hypothetical protein
MIARYSKGREGLNRIQAANLTPSGGDGVWLSTVSVLLIVYVYVCWNVIFTKAYQKGDTL